MEKTSVCLALCAKNLSRTSTTLITTWMLTILKCTISTDMWFHMQDRPEAWLKNIDFIHSDLFVEKLTSSCHVYSRCVGLHDQAGRWERLVDMALQSSYKSRQKHNVLKHVTRKHQKGEKLSCPGCNKFLRNKYDFNEHLARKHPTLNIERKELMSLDV